MPGPLIVPRVPPPYGAQKLLEQALALSDEERLELMAALSATGSGLRVL